MPSHAGCHPVVLRYVVPPSTSFRCSVRTLKFSKSGDILLRGFTVRKVRRQEIAHTNGNASDLRVCKIAEQDCIVVLR